MSAQAALRNSERRSEHLLSDLLRTQGWDLRRPPQGDLLIQHEYRSVDFLRDALARASKSAAGAGVPEGLLIDRDSDEPIAVIEAKARSAEINKAVAEAQGYAGALINSGYRTLAIALAGTSDNDFKLRVSKWNGKSWKSVTYDGEEISWIPTRADLLRLLPEKASTEIRPSVPPPDVLADRAEEVNRLLRESNIKDEFRPAVVAAVMLALWKSQGDIRRDSRYILKDINSECQEAFIAAGKPALARSLRVEEANQKLAARAGRIAQIFERLNVTVLTAEHDYLGQLYETFFRYTGGNTIGQYFTPRHITWMMTEVCGVTRNDVVLDPACGTGGFLVASMNRILKEHKLSRAQVVKIVKRQLLGMESEPVTAALCVANMILRGDGSTGVVRGDCFTSPEFPIGKATVGLMNPPFPHKKTDTPTEAFVDRALEGLKKGGKLAVVLPTSLLVKRDKASWRESVLKNHTLLGACQLPDELFQPFASATTSIVFLEKGNPHHHNKKAVFVRLNHDGLTLKKGVRVERPSEPNQIEMAIDAILNKTVVPGFSGLSTVSEGDEWAVGAYIQSAEPEIGELKNAVDVLLRRMASFYTRYADEVMRQREAIKSGDLEVVEYRDRLSAARLENARALSSTPGTVGHSFEIVYGMKELHSRDGIPPGTSLIISPTESYNGCYGWLEFSPLLQGPFVTVAQTGSIGEAFVQWEPCAVNDDCLVLLPRDGVASATLVLAAACLHAEKWRFTYGRKLTPQRIADFKIPSDPSLLAWVEQKIQITKQVIDASLAPYIR